MVILVFQAQLSFDLPVDCGTSELASNTYHGVMGFSDILQLGMSCLRTDGAQNCTRYLFPNSSFPASELLSNISRLRYCKIKQLKFGMIIIPDLNS